MASKERKERGRELRLIVLDCIRSPDSEGALSVLCRRVAVRRLFRPLTSLIRVQDEDTKYGAVSALGWATAKTAETDLEAARDMVRRLMLSLTEESGGIGWGAPEAIGEILARHEGLAVEFGNILVSYAHIGCCNYIDHEPLQRGVLWGLGRLVRERPELLRRKGALDSVGPHLESKDAASRALAAWTVGLLGGSGDVEDAWVRVLDDNTRVRVYLDGELLDCRVRDVALRATLSSER